MGVVFVLSLLKFVTETLVMLPCVTSSSRMKVTWNIWRN